ncbi:MAG: hypothetical protein ACPG1A_01580 [Halioglobus sp.]
MILTAGELTPGQPVNGFLREVIAEQQWQLLGDGYASEGFAYHSLMSAGACYDAFYSPRDPGDAEGRQALVHAVGELKEAIGLLATQGSEPRGVSRVRPEPDE